MFGDVIKPYDILWTRKWFMTKVTMDTRFKVCASVVRYIFNEDNFMNVYINSKVFYLMEWMILLLYKQNVQLNGLLVRNINFFTNSSFAIFPYFQWERCSNLMWFISCMVYGCGFCQEYSICSRHYVKNNILLGYNGLWLRRLANESIICPCWIDIKFSLPALQYYHATHLLHDIPFLNKWRK